MQCDCCVEKCLSLGQLFFEARNRADGLVLLALFHRIACLFGKSRCFCEALRQRGKISGDGVLDDASIFFSHVHHPQSYKSAVRLEAYRKRFGNRVS